MGTTQGILWILAAVITAQVRALQKPHILFLAVDDLGWDDLGFRQEIIRTPTIDAFAHSGIILNNYYVQSVCSPSRATFLTGRYPLHNSVNDWLVPGVAEALPLNETILPQRLTGYEAHMVGKWHLGFTKWPHTPTFRGFSSFYGFYTGGEDYFTHTESGAYDFRIDASPNCGANCSRVDWDAKGNYSTTLFTSAAVSLIGSHDPHVPLFLYLAYQAVHAPAEVPPQYEAPYVGVIENPTRRTFAGMISCLDEGFKNVTNALSDRGMLNNTLIIFTTDNGGPTNDTNGGDWAGSTNYPLRGGKHSIWEGGTRGTAFVWAGADTGLIPARLQGSEGNNLMHASDWFPTLCAVASADCSGLEFDGVDQSVALFKNGSAVRSEVHAWMEHRFE